MKKREILKRWILGCALTLLCLGTTPAFAQSIWTNPITGTNPNTAMPYTAGQTFDANISVSGIGRGAGITGTNANDRYNANSWNTAAIDLSAYFEFTLTPDPGCEIDFTSFVYTGQASSSGATSFAFRSSVDGFTANIGAPVAGGATISLAAGTYQNITAPVTFRLYGWGASASTGTFSVNSFTFNGTVTCGCSGPVAQPTSEVTADNVTAITCTSAQVLWTASADADNVLVVVSTGTITDDPQDGTAYTANNTFGAGEELVPGDLQYVVYNGSGTSVTINGLLQGTTYNYAVFGYDGVIPDCEENYLTGGVFGSFTTLTGCASTSPQITSLMINSCNGSNEGTDEIIVFENGSDPINIDDMVIDLPNTTWCNSGCSGNTIVNNSTYVNDLNAMAGCALFVYANPIPAGATVIIFTGDPPSSVLDYSSQCGAPGAPFYVMFLNNSSITGNFVNSGGTPKTVDITFAPGVSDAVTYIPDDADNSDGATVQYDEAGNPTYFTSSNCVYPLSLQLVSFRGYVQETANMLEWNLAGAANGYFEVQRSSDGFHFEKAGVVMANTESAKAAYSFSDDEPLAAVAYYRLVYYGTQFPGFISPVVSVIRADVSVAFRDDELHIQVDRPSADGYILNIYSISGARCVSTTINNGSVIPFASKGLFIVEIPALGYRQKFACF